LKCYENPRVADWAIKEVGLKMSRERTGPLHASEIYHCFRKTYYNRTQPIEWGRDAILKFATGFALQEWFFGPEKDGDEILGIILSPDRIVQDNVLEFKTTRRSYEKYEKDEKGKLLKNFPKLRFNPEDNDQWILRTRAYCAAHNVYKAHILVFFLFSNELHAWTLEFTDEELDNARDDIVSRRIEMEVHLTRNAIPHVNTRMGDWECGFCPHLEHCLTELKADGWREDE
jgi:hypothetical protein